MSHNKYHLLDEVDSSTVTTVVSRFYRAPGGRGETSVTWGKRTVKDAVDNYLARWASGSKDILYINNALVRSGMVRRGANANQFATAYERALRVAARMNAGGNTDATVFDAIQMLSDGGGGSRSQKATYKTFAKYTNAQIKDKAISAYQAILGRQPTAAEIAAFGRAIRAGAKAAPQITRVSASGKVRSDTQGFDESAFIAGYMANHIPAGAQDLDGVAGEIQDFIASFKTNYGVNPTQSFIENAIKTVVGAQDTKLAQSNLEQQLKEQAQILFPALKDKIDAGMTVRAIADPFISVYSNLMEMNDMNVNLDNSAVKEALSAKNDKGEYELMNIDQYAKKIRSSAEWLNTNNAKETMLSAAESLLQQFGFKR